MQVADTSFLYALFSKSDVFHSKARRAAISADAILVPSEIYSETVSLIHCRVGLAAAKGLGAMGPHAKDAVKDLREVASAADKKSKLGKEAKLALNAINQTVRLGQTRFIFIEIAPAAAKAFERLHHRRAVHAADRLDVVPAMAVTLDDGQLVIVLTHRDAQAQPRERFTLQLPLAPDVRRREIGGRLDACAETNGGRRVPSLRVEWVLGDLPRGTRTAQLPRRRGSRLVPGTTRHAPCIRSGDSSPRKEIAT